MRSTLPWVAARRAAARSPGAAAVLDHRLFPQPNPAAFSILHNHNSSYCTPKSVRVWEFDIMYNKGGTYILGQPITVGGPANIWWKVEATPS